MKMLEALAKEAFGFGTLPSDRTESNRAANGPTAYSDSLDILTGISERTQYSHPLTTALNRIESEYLCHQVRFREQKERKN